MLKKNIIKLYVIFAICAFLLISCKQDNNNDYIVEGNIENVEDGHIIIAQEFGDSISVDTISVDNKGAFKIKGNIDTLSTITMYFNNNTSYTYFFVDKGAKITINGDALYPDLFDIKGQEINNDLTAFKKQNKDIIKKINDILKIVEDSSLVENQSSTATDKTCAMELKNIHFELSNIVGNYVKEHPDKIASVVLINAVFHNENSLTRLDESLSKLRGDAANYYLTKDLFDYSNRIKRSMVGAISPNFTRKDIRGKEYSLVSFRGKYLMLFFVSSTCPLCESQRSKIMALYDKFKKNKENIEFLTVTINTEEEPVSDDIRKNVKWPILIENGGWSSDLLDMYNVNEVPFFTIISPTGIILRRNIPLTEIEGAMAEIKGE